MRRISPNAVNLSAVILTPWILKRVLPPPLHTYSPRPLHPLVHAWDADGGWCVAAAHCNFHGLLSPVCLSLSATNAHKHKSARDEAQRACIFFTAEILTDKMQFFCINGGDIAFFAFLCFWCSIFCP